MDESNEKKSTKVSCDIHSVRRGGLGRVRDEKGREFSVARLVLLCGYPHNVITMVHHCAAEECGGGLIMRLL
jgi:hypothetical protein